MLILSGELVDRLPCSTEPASIACGDSSATFHSGSWLAVRIGGASGRQLCGGEFRTSDVRSGSSPLRWSGPVAHGGTTHSRREVQLSNALLTLTVAPAAEPDVGFLALTVSTSAVGEWLQPLRCGPMRDLPIRTEEPARLSARPEGGDSSLLTATVRQRSRPRKQESQQALTC